MKRKVKTSLSGRAADIFQSDKGTSIVFVTIIAIIIVTGIVVLRITTSSLWATADKQYYQDRAYVMASSMGASIDLLISDGTINLENYQDNIPVKILEDKVSNDTVIVTVTQSGSGYLIEATATVPNSRYVYRAYYYKSETTGSYVRQLL